MPERQVGHRAGTAVKSLRRVGSRFTVSLGGLLVLATVVVGTRLWPEEAPTTGEVPDEAAPASPRAYGSLLHGGDSRLRSSRASKDSDQPTLEALGDYRLRGRILLPDCWRRRWREARVISLTSPERGAGGTLGDIEVMQEFESPSVLWFESSLDLPVGLYMVEVAPFGHFEMLEFRHNGPPVEFAVRPPVKLVIRITGPSQTEPCSADVRAVVLPSDGRRGSGTAQRLEFEPTSKTYSMETAARWVRVLVDCPGARLADSPNLRGRGLLFELGEKSIVHADVNLLPAASLRVRVLSPHGEPVPSTVNVDSADPSHDLLGTSADAGENGEVIFDALPAGRYIVYGEPEGDYEAPSGQIVDLKVTERADVVIRLRPTEHR